MDNKELWLPIKGYEGRYLISNYGKVKTTARQCLNGNILPEKELKKIDPGNGYYRVTLCKNSETTYFLVHRLVAEHFIENPSSLPLVHHIDRNKLNNLFLNLQWVTRKQNSIERYKAVNQFMKEHNKNTARLYPSLNEIISGVNVPFVEEWKDIVEYEGFYQVSNKGNVRSTISSQNLRLRHRPKHETSVMLSKNKERKSFTVSRLVAACFLPNPHSFPIINHLNGDKTDNRMTNLEWTTYKQNTIHAFEIGLMNPINGNKCHAAKLNPNIISTIKTLYKTTELTQTDLGKMFNVSKQTIYRVLTGRSWNHLIQN